MTKSSSPLVNPQKSYQVALEGKYDRRGGSSCCKRNRCGNYVRKIIGNFRPHCRRNMYFTLLKGSKDNIPFVFAFALPISSPGINCSSDTYDHGKSHFDSSKVDLKKWMRSNFDNVLGSMERVFMYSENPSM